MSVQCALPNHDPVRLMLAYTNSSSKTRAAISGGWSASAARREPSKSVSTVIIGPSTV
jgi:hypothetical protein